MAEWRYIEYIGRVLYNIDMTTIETVSEAHLVENDVESNEVGFVAKVARLSRECLSVANKCVDTATNTAKSVVTAVYKIATFDYRGFVYNKELEIYHTFDYTPDLGLPLLYAASYSLYGFGASAYMHMITQASPFTFITATTGCVIGAGLGLLQGSKQAEKVIKSYTDKYPVLKGKPRKTSAKVNNLLLRD